MKSLKTIIKTVILGVILLAFNNIAAVSQVTSNPAQASGLDSVRISLLTCGPHNEVYSLYGHTAIRYENPAQGIDVAINYGMFSFNKPHFILRFVFGLTDYEMGIVPFSTFCEEYTREGRKVVQQTLNIDNESKERIIKAIETNYEPQNREYRYNYFYDNCTTRARDILVDNIQAAGHKVDYKEKDSSNGTFRDAIHFYNHNHRWARFGNDILLGIMADRTMTESERQFLPEHLEEDFATARLDKKPLVGKTTVVVEQRPPTQEMGFPFTPYECSIMLFFICSAICGLEIRNKRIYWGVDVAVMTLSGLAGLILFAMIFSQHPTVSLNLQILVFSPLPLLFLWNTVKATRRNDYPLWTTVNAVLVGLFFAGGLFQDYAEGMYFVALSLLSRSESHFVVYKMRKDTHE